jgi:hypothetical protein
MSDIQSIPLLLENSGIMAEDRHYLSEPRPCPGLELPSWEVDVMREGVDVPIMTVVIDKTNLPPRKGKGKKVAWQLPDNVDTLPKFGAQDKKRIMEIFKEKKKEIKRQKKRSSVTDTPSSSSISDPDNKPGDVGIESHSPGTPGPDGSNNRGNKGQIVNEQNGHSPSISNGSSEPFERGIKKHDHLPPLPAPSAPPGLEKLTLSGREANSGRPNNNNNTRLMTESGSAQHVTAQQAKSPQPPTSTLPPPPGMLPSSPPPGLHYTSPSRQTNTSAINAPPGLINPIFAPNGTSAMMDFISSLPAASAAAPPLPPISPGRCFAFSHMQSPDPNSVATLVAEAYYLLLSRNMINDLDAYYAPHAQRSLTVGGAHAVCASSIDRRLQLQSLTEMTFSIKGVVQQPSVSQSLLVSITGVSLKPPPHDQLSLLPFCHTLLLVPVRTVNNMGLKIENGGIVGSDPNSTAPPLYDEGFQIQNDTLCFLTTNDGTANQPSQSQPQQTSSLNGSGHGQQNGNIGNK